MARYENQRIKTNADSNRVFTSTLIPNPKDIISTIRVETTSGDRLDTLAKRYYDDSSLWWIIARANNYNGIGLAVPNGVVIEIPSPREINTYLREIDNLND